MPNLPPFLCRDEAEILADTVKCVGKSRVYHVFANHVSNTCKLINHVRLIIKLAIVPLEQMRIRLSSAEEKPYNGEEDNKSEDQQSEADAGQ